MWEWAQEKWHLASGRELRQGGYAPRVERVNDNTGDGPVAYDPIDLLPDATQRARVADDPSQAAGYLINQVLDRAHRDLAYYSRADEKVFYSALAAFRSADRDLAKMLIGRAGGPEQFQRLHLKRPR